MKKVLISLLLLPVFMSVSCGGRNAGDSGENGSTGDNGDTGEVCATEGETRSIQCGYNGSGTQEQTCTDGYWENDGDCDDPDECENEDTQLVACGYNDNGTQNQLCISGQWEDDGDCDDSDECENEDTQLVACGYNNNGTQDLLCISGQWEDDGDCDDPDECEKDTVRTIDGAVEVCVEGQWQYLRETRQWGSSGRDEGWSIAVDSNDNIYVTGHTEGAIDGNTHAGRDDIFLTKYSNNGTKEWTEQWGTSGNCRGRSVAVDSNDNIYVTGYAYGNLDGNTHAGNYDIFLTKYSADGTKLWTEQWGTSKDDRGYSVAVDSNDNIYVTGGAGGDLDGNMNAGGLDLFLTKWSADGTKLWTRQWGTSVDEWGHSVEVDSNDNIYVTGYTGGALDGNMNAGGLDLFLTKWSADGTKLWTEQWGTSRGDIGWSVAVDSNDSIYVTGHTHGTFDGNLSAGKEDIFLTKYSTDGTKQWTRQWGTSENDRGTSVAVDSNDNIYVTGYTGGSLDGDLSSVAYAIFFTKYSTDGTKQWTKQWGTSGRDEVLSIAVDSNDNIYVAGRTSEALDGNLSTGIFDLFFTKWYSEWL